jgi:hypothetical protein
MERGSPPRRRFGRRAILEGDPSAELFLVKAGYASMNFAIAAGPMTTDQRVIWLRLNVSQLYGELIDSAASPRVA